jgi:hypothetical protein
MTRVMPSSSSCASDAFEAQLRQRKRLPTRLRVHTSPPTKSAGRTRTAAMHASRGELARALQ